MENRDWTTGPLPGAVGDAGDTAAPTPAQDEMAQFDS